MRKYVKDIYKKYGINVNQALKILNNIPISLQCWQLDDIKGFEENLTLSGGIQTTGNYLGRARNFKELTQDLDEALKFIPGKKKINLHAIYQSNEITSRDNIGINQFKDWIKYAKERNLGLDYNPTIFSHPMLKDGLSLSSPEKEVRDYWIKHCINGLKITEYFAKETKQKSLINIWIPDGLKEVASDRIGPRKRLLNSLDEILNGYKYDKKIMDVSVESKVFGIGVESFTVGSNEFYLNYALSRNICCLLDTGHFHPTENVADKISSLLCFNDKLAFHVSRPVRWDSDHVLKLNDDLVEVANEIIKCKAYKNCYLGLDYFDASINRVLALIIGARNMQKALLQALLTPWNLLKEAQDNYDHSKVLALQEEIKTLPWNEVWLEYLKINNMDDDSLMYTKIKEYENEVLIKRN